jgi:hypothetical protein
MYNDESCTNVRAVGRVGRITLSAVVPFARWERRELVTFLFAVRNRS